MEYLLLRWSFLLVTALNENKWKIPDFCNCYRVCWVTQRELRSICAIKRRRVNKIISNERLPLYDRELERDRLCDLSSPTVQSLYTRCPLCEKTHFSENYFSPSCLCGQDPTETHGLWKCRPGSTSGSLAEPGEVGLPTYCMCLVQQTVLIFCTCAKESRSYGSSCRSAHLLKSLAP